MSKSAGTREWHFLKMVYGILLKGDGAEECLDLLVTEVTSHSSIGPFSSSCVGSLGAGIQDGLSYVCFGDW